MIDTQHLAENGLPPYPEFPLKLIRAPTYDQDRANVSVAGFFTNKKTGAWMLPEYYFVRDIDIEVHRAWVEKVLNMNKVLHES
jgi:hypothetical protein